MQMKQYSQDMLISYRTVGISCLVFRDRIPFEALKRRKKVARRGGFSGGMPGNMNNLMKQAQKMQRQMEENQKALEESEFKSTSGGGAVEVTVNGKKEVTKLKIDPEAVDPEDVEMLEDMIIAALNEAFKQVDDQKSKMMGQFGGGMGGLGSGLF